MPHTPGPWRPSFTGLGSVNILATDGHGPVATVRLRKSKTNNTSETNSNAALVSAAPDLLAALEGVLDLARAGADEHLESWPKEVEAQAAKRAAIAAAEAAVAKAKGA